MNLERRCHTFIFLAMYTSGMDIVRWPCEECEKERRGHPKKIVETQRMYKRIKINGKWQFVPCGWICPVCKNMTSDFKEWEKLTPEQKTEWRVQSNIDKEEYRQQELENER